MSSEYTIKHQLMGSFAGGFAVLWESSKRREEMTPFVISRFLPALYIFFRKRSSLIRNTNIPCFKELLFALAMSVVAYTRLHENDILKP